LTAADSLQLPSAKSRDFLLRVGSRYVAILVLLMHVPLALIVGQAYWLNTILPSMALTCLHFLMPAIVTRFGTLPSAVWFLSLSAFHTFWISVWCGAASGTHYYFFSISAVSIYVFHGYRRVWSILFVALCACLFAIVEVFVRGNGLVIAISPEVAPWLATANGLASFGITTLIGMEFSRATTEAELLLAAEKDRSERLLLNILPEPIAERLKKSDGEVIADRLDQVSVMFADLVGFTPYARNREPAAVVNTLNDLFSRFDGRVDTLGLEKIKTVGDAYMVIAGAPTVRPDHLEALASLALDLVDEVGRYRDPNGDSFSVRIGLHVGPVVTGVIGTRKMAYDVWGDTVNVASRLESTSLPNRIHVSPQVVRDLSERFIFEARGLTDIKGVGPMPTHFLVGKKVP